MPKAKVIDRREHLDPREFNDAYVTRRRPVLIQGALRGCAALTRWSHDHIRRQSGERFVAVKEWAHCGVTTAQRTLNDNIDELERYQSQLRAGAPTAQRPAYLHDLPLTSILPDAGADLETFPSDYFPDWYRNEWWKFAQIFLGPSHSCTPLHFDCLLTHNLFFQISGLKRFILIAYDQLEYCYPHHWRWSAIDADIPNYDRYPLYQLADPIELIVEPGDALYLPPGTLHYVRSLDCALSFNVDWHTRESVLHGILAVARGMPLKNIYYNIILLLGLWGGLSAKRLLPYYAPYLNYVS